jgi:tetratricopeptide (TPR) repeat protein
MSFEDKVNKFKAYINEKGYDYLENNDEKLFNIIYELFIENKVPEVIPKEFQIPLLRLIAGYYYINKDIPNAFKYLNMAIDVGDGDAFVMLAVYHTDKSEFDKAKEYYDKSLTMSNIYALYSYGQFHQFATKNFHEMKKYYCLSINANNNGSLFSATNMATYYCNKYKFNKMKIYLEIAINKNKKHEKVISLLNNYLKSEEDYEYAHLHKDLLNDDCKKNYNIGEVCDL